MINNARKILHLCLIDFDDIKKLPCIPTYLLFVTFHAESIEQWPAHVFSDVPQRFLGSEFNPFVISMRQKLLLPLSFSKTTFWPIFFPALSIIQRSSAQKLIECKWYKKRLLTWFCAVESQFAVTNSLANSSNERKSLLFKFNPPRGRSDVVLTSMVCSSQLMISRWWGPWQHHKTTHFSWPQNIDDGSENCTQNQQQQQHCAARSQR